MSLADAEIREQPSVVARLLERERPALRARAAELRRRRPRYVVIAARGSSANAARYAQHVFGRILRLPVVLATPSLHTLYDAPPRFIDILKLTPVPTTVVRGMTLGELTEPVPAPQPARPRLAIASVCRPMAPVTGVHVRPSSVDRSAPRGPTAISVGNDSPGK